jgi:DNA-binding transcriptional ArsR family regulator
MPDYPIPDMAEVTLEGVLKAIADPTRLELVRRLADGDPQPKGDLMVDTAVGKATMAHHFKTLREAGLTSYIIHGRTHEMRLRRDELDAKFPGLIDAVTRRPAAD